MQPPGAGPQRSNADHGAGFEHLNTLYPQPAACRGLDTGVILITCLQWVWPQATASYQAALMTKG